MLCAGNILLLSTPQVEILESAKQDIINIRDTYLAKMKLRVKMHGSAKLNKNDQKISTISVQVITDPVFVLNFS